MIEYCVNDPCETEATRIVVRPDDTVFGLCDTCTHAFEMGQFYGETVDIRDIDDYYGI